MGKISEVMYTSVHPTWVHTMLTCPITGDANSARVVKMVSVGFLPCQVTVSPFDINKYLEREIFRVWKHSTFPQLLIL